MSGKGTKLNPENYGCGKALGTVVCLGCGGVAYALGADVVWSVLLSFALVYTRVSAEAHAYTRQRVFELAARLGSSNMADVDVAIEEEFDAFLRETEAWLEWMPVLAQNGRLDLLVHVPRRYLGTVETGAVLVGVLSARLFGTGWIAAVAIGVVASVLIFVAWCWYRKYRLRRKICELRTAGDDEGAELLAGLIGKMK